MKKIETFNSTYIFLHEENDIDILSNKNKIKELQFNHNAFIYYYSELSKNKNIIKNKINYHNNTIKSKIFARNCTITELDNNIKNIFLNKYHMQGSDKSNITYGAYYQNELIAVTTFDNKRTFVGGEKLNEYELSRFATNSNHIVVGIFPKIINKFIKEYKPIKIISFANKRWTLSKNNLYTKNGFKLVKNIPQDYYYYKNNKILHKFNLGKSQIKKKYPNIYNSSKTELEMTIELGYVRIWDTGKYKYELYINSSQQIIFGFIYRITNLINNKIYIGQTSRKLSKRILEYKKSFLYNNQQNTHLQNSFNKYGFENFKFEVIDIAQNINELNEKEINYIKQYNSTNKKIGYNIESGGKNSIPTTETLEKMSKSHLGIKQTDSWVNKRIAIAGSCDAKKYGKKKTDEEKNQLSVISPKFWLGKMRSDKTKSKISKTKKENGLSDKQKKILYKTVYKRNILTNTVQSYESTTIAATFEHVNQSTISRWCKNKKNVNGYHWSY